mmetsp:Transcript_30227/g.30711  ORF Transcript_30227/g.30711 Transcript_30227/m.30711 type:complete len:293 (+) Transcript_30227:633-1511(+)
MLASTSTLSYITSAAALISCRDISSPPTILNTMPFALVIGKSSRGDDIAAIAASVARCFPLPCPIPISAVPAFAMIDLTSAKSTFTSPGLTMISVIPTTPCLRISSATKNASVKGVPSGTICNNLSFDTTISVSTASFISNIASLACCMRFLPSNPNGFVTTPTVSAPASFAHSATIGAAPDPVPPPMPAVTNTKSAFSTMAIISSLVSWAARPPICGFPPAPRPRLSTFPIFSLLDGSARLLDNACASVLHTHISTPGMFAVLSMIRFTAFPPPPPTPITFILHTEPDPSA